MDFFSKDKNNKVENEKNKPLSTPFKDGESGIAHDVIEKKEELLTFLGSYRHKNLQSKQAEKQLAVLTQNVIEAQTEYVKHQLQLGLDKIKKEDYNRYLADIAEINKDIVMLSTNAARALLEASIDVDEESFDAQHEHIARFKKMYDDGRLSKEDFDKQILTIQAAQSNLREYFRIMTSDILKSQLSTFEHTTKLFDENKISFKG